MPRARFDTLVHAVLGLAALAMVWLLQWTIAEFVPRADTFALRLRQTPEMLVSPAYVLRHGEARPGAGAAPSLSAGHRTSPPPSNVISVCLKPVS